MPFFIVYGDALYILYMSPLSDNKQYIEICIDIDIDTYMHIDTYRVEDICNLYVKICLLYITLYLKVNINIFILKYLFEKHIK